jgi:hypothetical protein
MKWDKRTWAFLLVFNVQAAGIHCFAQAKDQSPIRILSAKRAKKYVSMGNELKPKDPKKDVVLVVEIAGISGDDFKKIERDSVYVMAGERRCPVMVSGTGVFAGKGDVQLVLIVPQETTELRLVVGDYPPKAFKAEEKVLDELKSP